MKYSELKQMLNILSEKELEQDVIFNHTEYGLSGAVTNLLQCDRDLYYDGEDDPSALKTKKQLKEEGYDKEDIEEMDIEIRKGDWYFELNNLNNE